MEHPSALQQPQRPNRPGTVAPRASGSSRAGRLMTSGSSRESSWMEGGTGDGSSWFGQVTRAEAGLGACKRKKINAEQQAPGCPFPLVSEEARKEVMGAIYEHVAGWVPPQKNITSRAISTCYPDFTPATVKAVVGQVLCMIAENPWLVPPWAPQPPALFYPKQLSNICLCWRTTPIQVAQASLMCESVTTSPAACI